MTEDLVLLEEQARRFLASELVPHIDKWTEGRHHGALGWDKLRQAGLLCAAMPEEYGGAGGTFAHETVINRAIAHAGLDSIGAPLHSGIVAPYILNYGTSEQKKKWLPKLADRRADRRDRDERARHRLGPAGRAHEREEIRQRLCAEWLEDLHHQRPACEPDHRGGENRSGGRRQGHLADGGRDR
jgi:hypothetical protein